VDEEGEDEDKRIVGLIEEDEEDEEGTHTAFNSVSRVIMLPHFHQYQPAEVPAEPEELQNTDE
jgi:hypothetical protein